LSTFMTVVCSMLWCLL